MDLPPLSQVCRECSNNVAIYSDEGVFTYAELNRQIEKSPLRENVFFAPFSVETILHFFSLLRSGRVALPVSVREPGLPKIDVTTLPNEVKTLLFTSGTTGKPKLVMHGIHQHLYSASHPHPDLVQNETDRYLVSLPLNHIGGMALLFRAFSRGASIILGDKHKHLATHISFVPTQLKRFLNSEENMPHLKAILLGGAPIPDEICKQAFKRELPLYLTYGMTETCSQFATAPYHPDQGVHFGEPLQGREVKIEENGVIWVRGETLFSGYFGLPTPLVDGWFRTGDLGCIGQHGLQVKGRHDRVLISGGENISLDELETTFLEIPEVYQVHLSKRTCPEYGERPVAKVNVSRPIEVNALRTILEKKLARFKIPDSEDIQIHVG